MAGDDRYCLYLVTDLNLFSSCSGREAAFSEPTFSLLNFFPAFIIFQVAAFFFLALSKASKISRQLPSLAQTSVRPLLYLAPNERGAAPILCILSIKPFETWYLHFSYLNKIEILKECHPCYAASLPVVFDRSSDLITFSSRSSSTDGMRCPSPYNRSSPGRVRPPHTLLCHCPQVHNLENAKLLFLSQTSLPRSSKENSIGVSYIC